MKKNLLLLIVMIFGGMSVFAQNTHTIGAVPALYGNTDLPLGSYVIAMDNTNQPGAATFNEKAYGLAMHLLNNNVRLRWVIKAGKLKDANDFSVLATVVKPIAAIAATRNFKGGPFVIFAADLPVNINTLIDNFNNPLAANSRVKVYQTTALVAVDVRFDYLINGAIWKPKVAILNDGGNASIHEAYFTQASAPASNYLIELTPNFVNNCYTMATEPHNAKDTNLVVQASPLITTGTIIRDIRKFVQNGGNFLAQCHAIETYENFGGGGFTYTYGTQISGIKFDWVTSSKVLTLSTGVTTNILVGMHVTGGDNKIPLGSIVVSKTATTVTIDRYPTGNRTDKEVKFSPVASSTPHIVPAGAGGRFFSKDGIWRGDLGSNATITTPNYVEPDLSYGQFEGALAVNDGGSLQNFTLDPASGTNMWVNNADHHVSGSVGAPNQSDIATAGVSKLTAADQLGGMVFYLGNHDFGGKTGIGLVNGVRMYMNAVMTPTNPQGSLSTAVTTQCLTALNDPTVITCKSPQGPAAAYPLTYNLYADIAPPFASTNITGDVFLGSAVINNAGEQPTITISSPSPYRKNTNYVAVIIPNGLCLQPIARVPPFCASTLPVLFQSFTAARSQSSKTTVQLSWTTSTEINNAGFYVEVNKGNNNWVEVGFVASKALNGNSNADLHYTFDNFNNEKIMSQYRLRQVDIDAKIKYSDIRSVRGLEQKVGVIIYPNPTNDGKINIVFENANTVRDISVQDMSGRIIKRVFNVTESNTEINDLHTGMYIVRIIERATGEQSVQKIVVNNR